MKSTEQVFIRSFFKAAEKSNESFNSQKLFLSSFASQKATPASLNYICNCPPFASGNDPRFQYDIGPILQPGAKITLTDGAKF